jgi:hypothetical protein
MSIAFDLETERARHAAREPFLRRHWAMSLELGEGIRFQPETMESVTDQIQETLWSEGMDPALAPEEDLREAERSFAILAPRKEPSGWSIAATLMFGFPDDTRLARLEALQGFPQRLLLVLDDGTTVTPEVDGGPTAGQTRMPSVLALRYSLPAGRAPKGLRASHPALDLDMPGPERWSAWIPQHN